MLRHNDVAENLEAITAASSFQRSFDQVPRSNCAEVWFTAIATEGDEVIVSLFLISFEVERHCSMLDHLVRARRECPP